MLPNSPRTGGPGGPLGQAQLSNNGGGGLGISPSSAISSSVTNSVGPMLGTSTKTIVSSSGTIPLQGTGHAHYYKKSFFDFLLSFSLFTLKNMGMSYNEPICFKIALDVWHARMPHHP